MTIIIATLAVPANRGRWMYSTDTVGLDMIQVRHDTGCRVGQSETELIYA